MCYRYIAYLQVIFLLTDYWLENQVRSLLVFITLCTLVPSRVPTGFPLRKIHRFLDIAFLYL